MEFENSITVFKRGDLVRHLYQKQFCTGIVLDVRHDPMDGARVQVRFSVGGLGWFPPRWLWPLTWDTARSPPW